MGRLVHQQVKTFQTSHHSVLQQFLGPQQETKLLLWCFIWILDRLLSIPNFILCLYYTKLTFWSDQSLTLVLWSLSGNQYNSKELYPGEDTKQQQYSINIKPTTFINSTHYPLVKAVITPLLLFAIGLVSLPQTTSLEWIQWKKADNLAWVALCERAVS